MTKKEFREIEKKLYSKVDLEKSIKFKLKKITEYENGANLPKKNYDFCEKVQGSSIYKTDIDIRFKLIENLRLKILEEQKKLDIIDTSLNVIKNDKYYNIVVLRYLKKISFKEISIKLNVDKKTIQRNLIRLLEQIKILIN